MRHCPSARARPGALLLGLRSTPDRVSILASPIPVDAAFVAEAARHGRPEERFRFAERCIEKGCRNWAEGCAVGASLMAAPPRAEVPACALRETCRWHAEHGEDVCRRCTAVVTDVPLALPGPQAA